MSSVLSKKIIKFHEENPFVNVQKLAEYFDIKIIKKQMLQTEVGLITSNIDPEELKNKKPNFEIHINKNLTLKEANTTIAMLLADYILKKERLLNGIDITFDIFSLKEIRDHRFSKTVQLATRLVVPEKTLMKFKDLTDDKEKYAKKVNLSSEFVNCIVKDQSLEFLISNEMIWGQNTISNALKKKL